jgi:chemotaxis protein MotB
MALSRARRDRGVDYWPGFVDALSTLILGIIFLLTLFEVVQIVLSQEVTGKDTALQQLSAKLAQLTDLLGLERSSKSTLEEQLSQLRASLATTENERDRIKGMYEGLSGGNATAQNQVSDLTGKLDAEKQVSLRALAQVEVLNQQIAALRRQLTAIEQALEVSEKKDKDSQSRLSDLGQRLNVALAARVQELSRYRSDFFGRLREILGNRPDIRVVGDRFVLPSEVLFDTGQSVLKPDGRAEIDKIASALIDISAKIPQDIPWVLRVDGHTDVRPVGGGKTNWDLSASRAIAVVQYLISKGLPPQRLVAAGFGEFQPIDPGNTEEAYSKNRRIELKLTER